MVNCDASTTRRQTAAGRLQFFFDGDSSGTRGWGYRFQFFRRRRLASGVTSGAVARNQRVATSRCSLIVTGYARTQSVASTDNDFVIVRIKNQAVPEHSTRVYVNSQGNIEIADLWGRDDRFDLRRVGDSIVVRESSNDTHSKFRVVNLPAITGDGTREITIPISSITATGKPLIINSMAGDDLLIADNDAYNGPTTACSSVPVLARTKFRLRAPQRPFHGYSRQLPRDPRVLWDACRLISQGSNTWKVVRVPIPSD